MLKTKEVSPRKGECRGLRATLGDTGGFRFWLDFEEKEQKRRSLGYCVKYGVLCQIFPPQVQGNLKRDHAGFAGKKSQGFLQVRIQECKHGKLAEADIAPDYQLFECHTRSATVLQRKNSQAPVESFAAALIPSEVNGEICPNLHPPPHLPAFRSL